MPIRKIRHQKPTSETIQIVQPFMCGNKVTRCIQAFVMVAVFAVLSSSISKGGDGSESVDLTGAFSSNLRSGAGQNLLPSTWPSLDDMRQGIKNSNAFAFSRDNSRGYEMNIQRLVEKIFSDNSIQLETLEYLWLDLNADDQYEVVVRIAHSGYCGSIGCSGIVLENKGGEWKKIGGAAMFGGISIGPPVRQNYYTLWFGDMCAVWEGTTYDVMGDDRQDGDQIHAHACGKNYNPKTANATFACPDCHT